MYQALYRKWRPLCFADVIGQRHITDTLRSELMAGRLSHAYLFTGTRGTGKTSCAKILARAVNCEHPVDGDPCNKCAACLGILNGSVMDVVEIDAASNNGVDNIRDIRDEAQYTPATVRRRVYIIDEVHMLSQGAFNAMLKTLEEPPAHVLFILATTEIHKVPATILSRCQRFDFRRIAPEAIAERLLQIARQEEIPLTDSGAAMIARLADGAMRDALSMLDRTAAGGEFIDENTVSRAVGILGGEKTAELMQCIQSRSLVGAVALIGECYIAGRDLSAVLDQVLGLVRDILLVKASPDDVSAMLSPAYSAKTVREFAKNCAAATLIAYTRVIQDSLMRMKNAASRRVEAELCILRLCALSGEDYDSLGGRVDALEEAMRHGIPSAPPVAPAAIAPDAPQEPKPAPKPATPQRAQINEWPQWPQLLDRLSKQINMGAFVNIKLSARGTLDGNTLTILADDSVTEKLASSPATKEIIVREASALIGEPCVVKIREVSLNTVTTSDTDKIDALLTGAQKNGVPITTF